MIYLSPQGVTRLQYSYLGQYTAEVNNTANAYKENVRNENGQNKVFVVLISKKSLPNHLLLTKMSILCFTVSY